MIEEIIRYIDGEMSKDEKAAFEARLSADADLRAELKNARAAKKVSEDFIVAETLETISKIRNEGMLNPERGKGWRNWIVGGLILIILGLLYWMMTKDNTDEGIMEDTMIMAGVYEEPIWPLERSDNDILSLAVRLHLAERTDEGLELLLGGDEVHDIHKYWAAEIMVHAGRYKDAVPILNELVDTEMEPRRVKLLREVCAAKLDMQGR